MGGWPVKVERSLITGTRPEKGPKEESVAEYRQGEKKPVDVRRSCGPLDDFEVQMIEECF